MMMDDVQLNIWKEKFSDFLPSYLLRYDNHTNFNYVHRCTRIVDLEHFCTNENVNFLGIAKPPYNPYGDEFNYAAVFEDINNDYEIAWHHCSRKWINSFRKELGIEEIQKKDGII